jgi:capsular exopolysaccharide synthesis family protein
MQEHLYLRQDHTGATGADLDGPTFTPDLSSLGQRAVPAARFVMNAVTLHKWSLLLTPAAAIAITLAVLSTVQPIYRSTATVLIEQGRSSVTPIEEVYGGIASSREFFLTQGEFLRSHEVASRVVRQMQLADNPEFSGSAGPFDRAIERVRESLGHSNAPDAASREASGVIDRFMKRVSIEPVRGSQLFRVSFESADPATAANVANEIVDTYIRADLDARYEVTQQAGGWMSTRLAKLKQRLDGSERDLQQYRERTGSVASRGPGPTAQSRDLDELTEKLVDAEVKRIRAEKLYAQVQGDSSGRYEVGPVANHPSVAKAREVESDAARKVAEVSERYGSAHPEYVAAETALKAAQQTTRRLAEGVVASLSRDFETARAIEGSLRAQLSRARDGAQKVNRDEIDLGRLEREVATNRQLYQAFLSRVRETGATADFLSPIARMVDGAVPSAAPVKPRKLTILAVMGALGLLAGVALALFRYRRNSTITNTAQVEERLGVPLLTATPTIDEKGGEGVAVSTSDPLFVESVRTAMVGLMLATVDERRKVFTVTSAAEGEGKTTFACSLAKAHARNSRTLLIDADMRRPSVGLRLGMPADAPGLREALESGLEASHHLHPIRGTSLTVMPSGSVSGAPFDLIVSSRFHTLMKSLSEQFDVLIVDCPPVGVVSDAMLISAEATAVIFVVRAARTPVAHALSSIQQLRGLKTPIAGVVLNGHDFGMAEKYYGEYSGHELYRGYVGTARKHAG